MKRTRLILALLILVGGMSCGGGGSNEPFFAGIWRGTLSVASNSCSFAADSYHDTITVNQLGDEITVQTRLTMSGENLGTFTGYTTGDDSFVTTREIETYCVNSNGDPVNRNGISLYTYRFTEIDGDSARVTLRREATGCGNRCDVERRGAFTRN